MTSFPAFFFVAPDGTLVNRVDGKPEDSAVLEFVAQTAEDYPGTVRPTAD